MKTAKDELIKVVEVLETSCTRKETMKNLSLLKLKVKDRSYDRGQWLHSHILTVLEQCSDEEELSSLSHIVDTVLYNINSFVLPRDGQDILERENEEDDGYEEIKEESDLSEDEGNEESEESDEDERNERKKVSRQGKENKGIYQDRKHPLVSIEESIKKFKKIDRSSWGKFKKKMGFPEIGIHVESLKRWGYNQDGAKEPKYFYLCPFSECPCKGEFRSPRTADAHINRILGYEYGPCKKCGKGNANLDIFNKHKCKQTTQVTRKRKPDTESYREKDRKRPRVSTEQKRKRDESPLTERYRRVLSEIERKGKGSKKVPKKQIKGFFSTDSSEEDIVDNRRKRKRVSTAQHLAGDEMDEDFRKKRKTKNRVSSDDGDEDIVPKSRKKDKVSKGKGSKKFTITDSEDEHGDAHDGRKGTRKDQKRRDGQDSERTGLDLLKYYEDSDAEGENEENENYEKEQDDKRNKGKEEKEETEEERKIRKKREKKLRKEKKRRERERENENNEERKQTEAEKTEREDEHEEGKQTDENEEGHQTAQDRREREGRSELTDQNEEGRETKEERRARRKKEKKERRDRSERQNE